MKPARRKSPLTKATPRIAVLPQIRSLIDDAQYHAATAANLAMVSLYWNIGRIVTEDIQRNARRAEYGERLLEQLAERLTDEYGRGYSRANLQDMRRFFEQFEICQTLSSESAKQAKNVGGRIRQTLSSESARKPKKSDARIRQTLSSESRGVDFLRRIEIDFRRHFFLSWSHYRILLGIDGELERGFYFDRTAKERWSTRELRRQMSRALFQRVAHSPDTRKLIAIERGGAKPEVSDFGQLIKDPYLLDFLGLAGAYSERDLEDAIIANLQKFLSELGSDFCFIGRQHPMRIDDEDYWLDLLFYHRGLRCLVAVDLKIGAFAAADKGQMDLYLAWLKAHDWRAGENEPVGLILCTSHRKQHVELLTRGAQHKMHVAEFSTHLPSMKVLTDRLKLYSKMLDDADAWPKPKKKK
jgi:predicted nuclease of restriction endonuclease-like (RecB) superfamily